MTRTFADTNLVRTGSLVIEMQRKELIVDFIVVEVKQALWAEVNKPYFDGYGSQFFKDTWNITGEKVIIEVWNFSKKVKC